MTLYGGPSAALCLKNKAEDVASLHDDYYVTNPKREGEGEKEGSDK